MKKTRILTAIAAASALLLSHPALALPNTQDTRMLSEPAVSSRHIAFIYAGDLWLSNLDGGGARRLTSDLGDKSNPVFSPDGSLIAYSANIDGNVDVYVIAAAGGVPRRLTFHPGVDLAQSFTPDGRAVMFTSPRAAFNNRFQKLFTVPVAGGVETQLEIPNASRATYSPDGKRIAYNPLAPAFKQWKRYRGGTNSWLWLFSSADKSIEKIPQPTTRSNDVDPMWIGDTVYFRSDRNGEFNLFAYDVKTKAVRQLTQHKDFPVLNASAANGTIVYEQAGYLHSFDIAGGQARKLTIGVASDLGQARPRWVKNAKYIRDASVSPSGARIAFEYRGEIVTIPADKGDVRNLTQTAGAHERTPIWSPDGRSVAYFSDESGEYELHVRAQDGKGAVRKYKLNGSGFYDNAVWSPDSKKIAFADNGWSMYVIDVGTGKVQRIATEPMYGVDKSMRASWAPDSRWLAYTLNSPTYTRSAYIYSVEQNKSMPVTDGLSDVAQPVFDKSGKYLYFFASTNAGPSNNWFSQQNEDNLVTRTVWMAVLRRDLPSPLIKESDEEKAAGAESKKEPAKAETEPKSEAKIDPKTGRDDPKVTVAPVAPISIDFDGIATRIVDLPLPAAQFSSLTAGAAGQIFLLRESDGKKAVQRFDLKERKAETVVAEADDFEVSADGKKLLS